jgi:hypothetical protein
MPTDQRIQSLTTELARLRNCHEQADNQLHALLLKSTEIQLNLAVQDRTLGKLEAAIHGNGQPGLITRVDRIEHLARGLVKAVWLLTAATTTAAVRWVMKS